MLEGDCQVLIGSLGLGRWSIAILSCLIQVGFDSHQLLSVLNPEACTVLGVDAAPHRPVAAAPDDAWTASYLAAAVASLV